ncbi:hypothetical protein MCOR29_003582 [Pyricularia oryzae]|uniref:Uncharacterized protein n=1 Tax=Pyricularia grisea TaxID=148305 RepID=A0ABQ8N596_PYRGI|nr:hypothetical protein MCOR01_011566 [Pyricularia oryzae]KAI6291485.1 hypothetical protein MCOR33_010586 [Pyricularia grisea]KAI6257176.1 hypothetical protein MCOR19_006372 [Pyricularia oryzae]KAI6277279.1 hypothetical protein MCOR26_005224 [Pyricularia oryzae]KAI6326087.1 hypothetical protein MCOR29_003582 [Pyricularia oryzae]
MRFQTILPIAFVCGAVATGSLPPTSQDPGKTTARGPPRARLTPLSPPRAPSTSGPATGGTRAHKLEECMIVCEPTFQDVGLRDQRKLTKDNSFVSSTYVPKIPYE